MESQPRPAVAPVPTLPELVTLGETMVAFVVEPGRGMRFEAACIGAESNVAIGFAQFGGHATWISRLGDDALGRLIHDTVTSAGVEASVGWSESQQTGVAVKELGENGTSVRYYRSESAARGLRPQDVPSLAGAGWLHLTGVTPALSPSADATVDAAISRARLEGVNVSFDVNLRPRLWPDQHRARHRLLELCRAADLVFIGSDEASALTGARDSRDFARLAGIGPQQELVFKDGAGKASVLRDEKLISADAHQVPVVDVTGAGDAFAAGYLSALREGYAAETGLRWGHWNAARVVQVSGDLPPAPTEKEMERVRSLNFDTPLVARVTP